MGSYGAPASASAPAVSAYGAATPSVASYGEPTVATTLEVAPLPKAQGAEGAGEGGEWEVLEIGRAHV